MMRSFLRRLFGGKNVDAPHAPAQDRFMPIETVAAWLADVNVPVYDEVSREGGDGPIAWWIQWIVGEADIYGRRLPSDSLRLIPHSPWFHVAFEDGKPIVPNENSFLRGPCWRDINILKEAFYDLKCKALERGHEIHRAEQEAYASNRVRDRQRWNQMAESRKRSAA